MSNLAPRVTYQFIDGLRGYAIALVLLVHAGSGRLAIDSLDKAAPVLKLDIELPSWLLAISASAGHGVQLFFVVSAMSLTLSLISRNEIDLGDYVKRRFLRIAPMFYVGVVAYLLMFGFGPRAWAPAGISWREVVETLLLVHAWFPNALNSVVPGGWSIGDEASFYVLLPTLFILLRWSRRMFWGLIAVALVIVQARYALGVRDGTWTAVESLGFVNQVPVFLIGMMAGWMFKFHPATVSSRWWAPLLLIMMVAILPQIKFIDNILQHHLAFSLISGVLCYLLSNSPPIIFTNKSLSSLGKVSFSVYLLHFALLHPAYQFSGLLVASRGVAFLLIYYIILLSASYVLACITYRYIEHPFIRLGVGDAGPFRVWYLLGSRSGISTNSLEQEPTDHSN